MELTISRVVLAFFIYCWLCLFVTILAQYNIPIIWVMIDPMVLAYCIPASLIGIPICLYFEYKKWKKEKKK